MDSDLCALQTLSLLGNHPLKQWANSWNLQHFVSNYFFARNNGILISLGRYFVRLSLVVMLKGLTTVLFPDAVWLLKVFFNLKASKI